MCGIMLVSKEPKIYLAHASVRVSWQIGFAAWKSSQWHLNNLLLECSGPQVQINREMEEFCQNRNSAPNTVIWDAFEAYIRGVV